MKAMSNDPATESAIPLVEKAAWIAPEISDPKELIDYPEGLLLQGGSGDIT